MRSGKYRALEGLFERSRAVAWMQVVATKSTSIEQAYRGNTSSVALLPYLKWLRMIAGGSCRPTVVLQLFLKNLGK